ncbi:MAG: putative transposase [Desulfobacteraceae bacterium Eth-SRB2]|nr:MAG: putative transposase [Desulfobacteraceae bacterium Eth-SRB2]
MNKERYRKGAHTVTELKYHFVWKTKYSYSILKGEIALRLRDIIRKICTEKEITIEKGNVRSNYIHILINAPSHLSPAKMAQYLKGKSSYRLQREFPKLQKRYWGRHLWGRGYFRQPVKFAMRAKLSNISKISQMNLAHLKFGMNQRSLVQTIMNFSRIYPSNLYDFSPNALLLMGINSPALAVLHSQAFSI